MKFRADRDALSDAVSWVYRTAVAKKPTLPILGYMLMVISDEYVDVCGFDYQVSARARVPVSVGEPGRFAVTGHMFTKMISKLAPGEVEVIAEGERATITGGTATFTAPLADVEDFPALPRLGEENVVGELSAEEFAAAATQTTFACSDNDTGTPMICGVHFEINPDGAYMASTDRYRLAARRLTSWRPLAEVGELAALIPPAALDGFVKALSGPVQVAFSKPEEIFREDGKPSGRHSPRLVGFASGDRWCTSALLAYVFPAWRGFLVEPTGKTMIEFDAEVMSEAMERASLVVEEKKPAVFDIEEDGIRISSGIDSRLNESIPATVTGVTGVTVRMNPGFFMQAVVAMQAPVLRLVVNAPVKPCLVVAVDLKGNPDTTYQHVLMPVRKTG